MKSMDDQMHDTAPDHLPREQRPPHPQPNYSLEAVFDAIEDGIFVYDALGRIIRVNPAARELLGGKELYRTPSASLQEGIERFRLRDPAKGTLLTEEQWPVTRLLRGETFRKLDVVVHTLDGQECIFSLSGAPVRTPQGDICGAVITVRDVTQVRYLAHHMHRIIDTLLHMAQITVQGVTPASASSKEATSSQHVAQHLVELTRDVLGCQRIGLMEVEPQTERQHPLAVVGLTPEQEQRWWAELRQQETRFGEGLPPELVERLRHNEVLLFDLREPPYNKLPNPYNIITMLLAPLCLGTRVVGLLSLDYGAQEHTYTPQEIGLTQAVTQLLAINIERERLHHANQRLTDLIALAHDAIIVCTPDGHIMFWNQGAEQLYGWSEQQALGQVTHSLLSTQFPVSLEAVEAALLEQGQWEGELVHTRDDGQAVTVESRQVLVRGQDQQSAAILEIDRDITERERLLADRAEAQANEEAARETSHLMDEFIGIAGHELRTPLSTLKASIQLAKRHVARVLQPHTPLPEEAASTLQQISQHLDRAERQVEMENRLVSDLLDISRLHANQFELSVTVCDLGMLVREVVEDQRILTPMRAIHLSLPENEDLLVIGDRDRLRQVVSNYLSNALKYSDATTSVQVSLRKRGGEGCVEVSDQGPGLSAEEQQRIWTQFYRVKNIRVKSGSGVGLGLGLYICKAIIERQGGQVGVESQVGVGSTFWFSLPLADQMVPS